MPNIQKKRMKGKGGGKSEKENEQTYFLNLNSLKLTSWIHILEHLDNREQPTSANQYTIQKNLMLLIQPELYLHHYLNINPKIMII